METSLYPIGGFHVTSSSPCWWTETNDLPLAPFVRPPAIVHRSIVICVLRDWLQITYCHCLTPNKQFKPFGDQSLKQHLRLPKSYVPLIKFPFPGTAERILFWGANKQAPDTLTCTGFWGNPPLENCEILKLGNATFSILDEIKKKKRGSTVKWQKFPPPPSPQHPRLGRPCFPPESAIYLTPHSFTPKCTGDPLGGNRAKM